MNFEPQGQSTEGSCAPEPGSDVGRWHGRTIGPWGTGVRAVAGVAGIAWAVAVPHEHPWLELPGASSDLLGLLVGLVAAPLVLTLAIRARGRNAARLHLGHGAACLVTLLAVLLAQFYPAAVLITISAPLLLLAMVGRSGCELLAVPNLLLRRNDYLFCLPFSPIDAWEHRHRTARSSAVHRQQSRTDGEP